MNNDRHKLNKIVKRAIEILRNEGIASLRFRALGRTVYRRVIMIERPLDEPIVHVAVQLPVTNGLLQKTEIGELNRLGLVPY